MTVLMCFSTKNVPSLLFGDTMLLTINELSLELKVPVATIYSWVHKRKIPVIKVGRHLRFELEGVLNSFKSKSLRWQEPDAALNTTPRSLTKEEMDKWRRVSNKKGDSIRGTDK